MELCTTMIEESAGSECVVIDIEDNDLNDQPGPVRLVHNPSACEFEAQWFEQPFNKPSDQVVCSDIPEKYLKGFKDLIWNQPHDRMVPGYGMTPKELACVSSDGRKGWLVTSHFYWLSRCINQQQNHTCFFVLDPTIKTMSLQKLLGSKSAQDVKRVIFVMSVGRQDDGVVFLGTDKTPGDHWSMAVVEISTGLLSYCDTLGWQQPEMLFSCIINYTQFFGLAQTSQLKLRMAHEPNTEQHECTPVCTNYPLQTCSDVCGVIAMICIAVAVLDKDLFELMMKPINKNFNLYLTDPTEFSTYLRHVIIYWIASNKIDITRISLKPNFDPNRPATKLTNVLKRKLEQSINGDATSPKRYMGLLNHCSINEYILEAFRNKESSPKILSEIVSKLGTYCKVKEANAKRLSSLYAGFTLNTNILRSKEDRVSTRSYLSELVQLDKESPIILFKNKGSEMQHLEKEDIVVAIQSPFQKEMMQIYGTKCLCVDWPKNKEAKYTVLTLLVFVNGTEELPVAWLVCNRITEYTISLFFKMLHSNVGNLQTSVFIGDCGGTLHSLWVQHFPKPGKKMFCSWEVQHLFHSQLDISISDVKIKSQIKDFLNALFYITNAQAFEVYVLALLLALKPHKKLCEYLKSKFISDSKEKFWASCYRHLPEYHYVPFIEPFTVTMKTLDIFSKMELKRMDIYVHVLLQLNRFLENKLYIMTCQPNLLKAVEDLKMKHEQPLNDIDLYQSPSGDEWYIPATEKSDAISIIDSGISTCLCPLKCDYCKICVHRYICTCVDYIMRPGSCKHIHFIQNFKLVNRALQDSVSEDSPSVSSPSDPNTANCTPGSAKKLKNQIQHELHLLKKKISKTTDPKKLHDIFSILHDV
uniref:SWIM-type domain-containing protein n=1 Tax=Biomphalaria glabrata TaxID=6526 RepID=A0A2C9LSL0_BIOGL